MKVRFQADADLNQIIVSATLRRNPAVDFQSSTTAGLKGLADQEVLALAAQQGRILVTHDRKTMPTQFTKFVSASQSTGVLIVSKKVPINVIVEELLLIWEASSLEEWINRIAKIPL